MFESRCRRFPVPCEGYDVRIASSPNYGAYHSGTLNSCMIRAGQGRFQLNSILSTGSIKGVFRYYIVQKLIN